MDLKELQNFTWYLKKVKKVKNFPSVKRITELYNEFCDSAQRENSNVSDNVDEKKDFKCLDYQIGKPKCKVQCDVCKKSYNNYVKHL